MAVQNRLVPGVLGDHGLAESLRADEDEILRVSQKVEAEDALDQGPIDRFGPLPLKVGHRFEAPQARALEAALETAAGAVLELGGCKGCQERDGGPAIFGGTRQEVIQILGDAGEPEPAQVATQGRGWGRG